MKKTTLFKTVLLLCALIVGSGSAWADPVTIWTENWSGTTTEQTPTTCTISGYSDITYEYANGANKTRTQSKSSFTSPELLIGKTNGSFTATIPSSRLTSVTTSLTLQFDSNRDLTLTVTNGTLGTKSTSGSTYTYPITVTSQSSDLVIEFKNTTGNNARFSNVLLTGTPSAVAPTAITFKTGGTTYTPGGETKNDLGSGASVDITIEANQTADIYYTVDGTTPTTSSTKYSAPVAITGPCTLKALAKNTAGEFTQSAAFKFSRANGLAFGESEYTAYLSEKTFSTTLTNPNSLDVAYSSTNEDVAIVASDGTVTLKTAGETTIKATFAGNDTYVAGVAQYNLTVSNKSDAELSFATDFYHIEEPTYGSEISAPVALTNPYSVTVAYSSSDETVATVNSSTGAVTPKKLGSTTIKASFAGDAAYEEAEVSYTLKLGLQDAGLDFKDDSKVITYTAAGTYTNVFDKDTDADAAFTSSNTSVATVNATTGEVTVLAVGTTTITATTAKTSDYKAGEASYTLTVTENTTPSGATPGEITIFYESFDKCNSTGGNDGAWSGLSNNENITDSNTDNSGWAATNQMKASYKCAYFGSSNKAGDPVSPAISFESDKTYTLSFKAANWGASADKNDGGTLTVKVGTTTLFDAITLNVGGVSGWGTYSKSFTDIDGSKTISFTKNTKRFFLDEVKVTQAGTPTISVTIPSSGWGTYCSAYKLDLSDAATEVQAYAITGYNASEGTITLAKVSGVVSAKTPLVIKGEAGSKKIAISDETPSDPSTNLLTGYLSPTYYDGDRTTNTVFGLSSGNFHKLTAGTIPANRAVLSMSSTEADKIPAEARLTFIIDEEGETTGVKTIEKRQVTIDGYYNLNGQRVAQPTKGLYIVNGRKVVIK